MTDHYYCTCPKANLYIENDLPDYSIFAPITIRVNPDVDAKTHAKISTGKKEDKLGIRGSDTCELYFDNCKVSEKNRLGQEGKGFKIALGTLDGGRIGIATQALGIAKESLDRSVSYANEREQFGKKIGKFGAIRSKIARMAINIDAARLLIYRAAKMKDLGLSFKKAPAPIAPKLQSLLLTMLFKYLVDMVIQKATEERLMRDAKITQIYEGTSEIQELVVAREILGGNL